MPYVDFVDEAHRQSTSWERADPDRALIEQVDTNTYRVMLPGGAVHKCKFGLERGGHVGSCECRGWKYRDDDSSPCAHLCTLRKAEFVGDNADDGEPVEAVDTFAETDAAGDAAEPELRADGGRPDDVDRPAAGSDGRTFGTPEGRL